MTTQPRNTSRNTGHNAFNSALLGIDVLRDIDLVIVPLRPRVEMIDAACDISGISPAQARIIYETMIRVSLPDLD